MKKFKYIKYTCLLIMAMVSFSCKKLLDEDPLYSINSKTAFESEATANMALLGVYGYMTSYSAYGQSIAEIMVGASGLSWAQTNGGDQDQFVSFATPATNSTVATAWNGWYKVIGEANFFISSVGESSLSDVYKKQAIAEAKFLRGLCYYNLANVFGGVPLRIEPTSSATITLGRSTRQQVYDQVEKDWMDAAENLLTREEMGSSAEGRATKYAAYAYLAKLYFTLASHENTSSSSFWAKAKEMGDKVILNGKYGLEPKFKDLFASHVNSSPESVFQLNFSTTSSSVGNRANWLFAPQNSTSGISWGRIKSSKAFYDQFKGTYPDDPRLKVTFGTEWKQLTNNQIQFSYPYVRSANQGTPAVPIFVAIDSIDYAELSDPANPKLSEMSDRLITNFATKVGDHQGWPYFVKQMDIASTAQNSNKNLILYRYADFLLLMADVENELGNTPKGVEYINQVLYRARNSGTISSVYPKDISTSITQSQLRLRIFDERLFELAGEYEMFNDTRRRGTDYLKIIVDRHNNHHITKAFIENAEQVGNTTNFRDRFLPNTPDLLKKNLLLPIPQDEINTNESITISDQNFGY